MKVLKHHPHYCITVGSAGTHNVCVCKIHQNLKLKFSSLNDCLGKSTDSVHFPISVVVRKILCENATDSCHLIDCQQCPGPEETINDIKSALKEKKIEKINYMQWTSTDRCNLEFLSASVNEFLTHLENDLKHYVKHDFIAHKQASYISTVKENLKEGEFLVSLDFAENYSFVVQDAIQSFHWNNAQATVHPYVIYYNNGDEIEHYNFVIISESLKHDTVAVSLFNKKMIHFLKQKHGCEQVRKIFFFLMALQVNIKIRRTFVTWLASKMISISRLSGIFSLHLTTRELVMV